MTLDGVVRGRHGQYLVPRCPLGWAREGRFYVVSVGQFKRGKAALVNAIIGQPLLPTGVVPVTAAVTVVRYGPRLTARVRFDEREWEDCEPRDLVTYVSEEHNPGNEKGVTGVEIFVPSPLLASGMCLVDTPGVGSVSEASTAATREFAPHVDVSLVVLGADPPISREEVTLLQDVARGASEFIVVLNKADRLADGDRAEAIRFTERVLAQQLGHPVGPILQVSALERLAGTGPQRDWPALIARLERLAGRSGAHLVSVAEERGLSFLCERLLRNLDQERTTLVRPIQETEARLAILQRAVTETERTLDDLAQRLIAAQDRLVRTFTADRDQFVGADLAKVQAELTARLRHEAITPAGSTLRLRAMKATIEVSRRSLDRWCSEEEARAAALFRQGFQRFVELVDDFNERLRLVPELAGIAEVDFDAALDAKSRFFYTDMLTVEPISVGSYLLDLLRTRAGRVRAIEWDAIRYLSRLMEVNSARLKNDFIERLSESRRRLESALRDRLRDLLVSTERMLDQARQAQAAGAAAVQRRLEDLQTLRAEAQALAPHQGA